MLDHEAPAAPAVRRLGSDPTSDAERLTTSGRTRRPGRRIFRAHLGQEMERARAVVRGFCSLHYLAPPDSLRECSSPDVPALGDRWQIYRHLRQDARLNRRYPGSSR